MKTILELDVTPKERDILLDLLQMMNISYRSHHIADTEITDFEEGGSHETIAQLLDSTLGMWKDRVDFDSIDAFRKQAWGGRGVK